MRRDLFCYYPLPVATVYGAYLRTANEKFSKSCREEIPGKVLSFALNFSFKYNMNGGAVTLHFMPFQNGTAIAMRYTIVQAMGARYKRHALDMAAYADTLLGVKAQNDLSMDMQSFINYESGAAPASQEQAPSPAVQSPATANSVSQGASVCAYCGTPLTPGSKFCVSCGNAVPAAQAACPNCGRPFAAGERFCCGCGAKRM